MLGSSTAYGTGTNPIDSSWVNKFRRFVQQQNPQVIVTNLATLGLTSFDLNPSGFIPAAGYRSPDTLRNITKGMSLNPDAIIINLPSNDIANGYTVQEFQDNMNRIVAVATAQNVPVWVTTTQPRDNLNLAERNSQVVIKDWVNQRFGNFSIDFWTNIATANATINPIYGSGDGIHLGNYGHHLLFTRVIDEKIWDTICIRKYGTTPLNKSPVAKAGPDITVTLPNIASVNATASFDTDGLIIAYKWRKISGAAGFIIAKDTARQTTISFTTLGLYLFELAVTDNKGAVGKDTLAITVNPANKPPVAKAGSDITIILPNIASVNGTASLDTDGIVTAYKWRKISGAAGAVLANDTARQTTISFTTSGQYQFELAVTDNKGATGKDTLIVNVNAANNAPPIAKAGSDITITLPNTASVNGTASLDTDGIVTAYKWRRISGAAGAVIANDTARQTTISFTTSGLYQFELAVTDNKGATGKDTLAITVNPANQPPVAKAGNDNTIRLPLSRVLLDGRSSSDPDGTITNYQWNLVSGNPGSQILTPAKDSTTVTFTSAGTYTFRLTVTDNKTATASDNVIITVQSASSVNKTIRVYIYGGVVRYNNPQWNNWNVDSSLTSKNFLFDDGTSSTVNSILSSHSRITDNGANYASTATICPPEVLRYSSLNTSDRTLSVRGLKAGTNYGFEFYASRVVAGNNATVFIIGTKSDTIDTDINISDYAKFNNITADVNGTINISLKRTNVYQYINSFIIKEQPAGGRPVASGLSPDKQNAELKKSTLHDNSINVYPNPISDLLSIRLSNNITGVYKLQLINAVGKIVLSKEIIKNNKLLFEQINTSHLSKGIYFLEIISDKTKLVNKIIKIY